MADNDPQSTPGLGAEPRPALSDPAGEGSDPAAGLPGSGPDSGPDSAHGSGPNSAHGSARVTDGAGPGGAAAKAAARARLRAARRRLTPAEIAGRGQALAKVLSSLVPPGAAVAGYLPMPGEPDVRAFLSDHAAGGGAVYVPVIASPDRRVLEWVRWTPEAVLQRSAFARIDEPQGDRLSTQALQELHTQGLSILVPGLAVDDHGARMGQGGGFYDTAFGAGNDLGAALRLIAVVHAAEVLSPGAFPVEPHDLRVHAIATERGAIRLRAL